MKKIFHFITISFLSLMLLTALAPILPAQASTGVWTQSDWSGGSGQTNWSVTNQYNTSSGINSSAANQIKMTANPINVSKTLTLVGGGATNWISLPHYNGYPDGLSLYNVIPNIDSVSYRDESTGSFVTYDGPRGVDFPIAPNGEMTTDNAYAIKIMVADEDFTITGQDQPGYSIQLHSAALSGGQDISLPFHLAATNAQQLFADIPNVTAVKYWDNSTGSFLVYDGSTNLNNFPITPGMAVTVTVSQDTTWTPTFNPASITYPSSSTLTSSTYSSNAPYTVWGPLSYNATTPANTSVSFQVSTDNGTTWQDVKNTTTQTFGPSPTLTYKVTLQNTDGLSTPTLTSVSIPYTTIPGATSSGGGSGITSTLPTPTPSLSPTPSASTPSPTPSSSITPSLQPTSLPSLPPSPSSSPLPTPSPTPSPTLSLPSTSLLPQSCSFTKNLYLGITDPQVHCLQIFLNTNGYTLSLQGFGSLHNETNYFGPLTQAALKRFQQAHQINPALGYFGPITRGFILSLTK